MSKGEYVNDMQDVVDLLRELAEDRRQKASEATTAQSRKYNQAAAYAYTISANTVEGKLEEHVKPCDNYHPLPCGLDVECEVPSEYFDAEQTSEEIWEDYQSDR